MLLSFNSSGLAPASSAEMLQMQPLESISIADLTKEGTSLDEAFGDCQGHCSEELQQLNPGAVIVDFEDPSSYPSCSLCLLWVHIYAGSTLIWHKLWCTWDVNNGLCLSDINGGKMNAVDLTVHQIFTLRFPLHPTGIWVGWHWGWSHCWFPSWSTLPIPWTGWPTVWSSRELPLPLALYCGDWERLGGGGCGSRDNSFKCSLAHKSSTCHLRGMTWYFTLGC